MGQEKDSEHQPAAHAFVGRARELLELQGALDDALAGHGRLLLIVGDPGIGKTRLAEELANTAAQRDASVLWGRGWEGGGAPVYWPWLQIIRTVLCNPQTAAQELGPGAASITSLLPEWHGNTAPAAADATDSADARFPLFDAVATFFKRRAAVQPLVLLLDDLHAADVPSLLLLEFLARDLHDSRLLIVGTYRDVEMQRAPERARLVSRVARNGRRIPLGGLSLEHVADFIAQTLADSAPQAPSPAVIAAVHQTTEGNPFFVDEVVRLLLSEHHARLPDEVPSGGLHIPHGVRDAIRERLRPLSEACLRVIALASVVGREFDLGWVQDASGTPTETLLPLLSEAVEGGILTPLSAGLARYSFKHALIRETLYEDVPAADRVGLHRRIGAVLERRYASDPDSHIAELAHHFLQAAPGGDAQKAVRYCMRAANRAVAVLAYEEAVAHYEGALQALALDQQPDQKRRLEIQLELGDAQSRGGHTASAQESFRHAADLARTLAVPSAFARAALGAGGVGLGVPRGSAVDPLLVGLLEEALEVLGLADSSLRARVLARLAVELYFSGSAARRTGLSKEAVDMARRVGNQATLAYVVNARHFALWDTPDVEERLAVATEGVQLAEQSGERDLAAQAHVWRLLDVIEIGDAAAWDTELHTLGDLAENLRQPRFLSLVATLRAMRALWQGRFDEVNALTLQAVAFGNQIQDGSAALNTGLQLYAMGRALGGQANLEETVRAGVERLPERPVPRCMLALLYADLGRADEARREFERLAAQDFEDLDRVNALNALLPWLTEVCVSLGDVHRAAVLRERLLPFAGRNIVGGPRICFGPATHWLGMLSATLGSTDEAARCFEDALERSTRLGGRPALAATQYEYARLLRSRHTPGDAARAAELAARALAAAQELGMLRLVERLQAFVEQAPDAHESARDHHQISEEEPGLAVANGRGGTGARVLRFPKRRNDERGVAVTQNTRGSSARERQESSGPTDARASLGPDECLFRQEGEYWTVGDASSVLRLKDTKGLWYIAQLLRHPDREFHVTDLAGLGSGTADAPAYVERLSDEQLARLGMRRTSAAEPGEQLLDDQAKAAYRRRLEDLHDQLDEATRFNDAERVSTLRSEMDFLARELARSVGLRGQTRRSGSPAERARLNVTRAVRAVIKRINARHAPLGRYLSTTIKTGTFCSYTPDPRIPISWKL